jgi:hypothetical protein
LRRRPGPNVAKGRDDDPKRKWIQQRLDAGEGWECVAESAAHYCQHAMMHMMPRQLAPLYYSRPHHFDALREPFGAREAAEIIKKLLAARSQPGSNRIPGCCDCGGRAAQLAIQ